MNNSFSVYSFEVTKYHYNTTNKLFLNDDFPGGDIAYNFPKALLKFLEQSSTVDNIKSKYLFKASLVKSEMVSVGNRTFERVIFKVKSGKYGYSSTIVNKDTEEMKHEQKLDEAAMREFFVYCYIPQDFELQLKANKGFIFFQNYGSYGVVTETIKQLNTYFRRTLKLLTTTRLKVVSSEVYWLDFINNYTIKEIRLLKYTNYDDLANGVKKGLQLYNEKEIVMKGINKNSKKFEGLLKQFQKVTDTEGNDFIEFDNDHYDNAKMVINNGVRSQTLNLKYLENWSVYINIEDSALNQGKIELSIVNPILDEVVENYTSKINLYGSSNGE